MVVLPTILVSLGLQFAAELPKFVDRPSSNDELGTLKTNNACSN